jgi:hypothetical protein
MWLKKTHHTHKKVGLMEWLKVKAVSSIPSTEKKKKKGEREREGEGHSMPELHRHPAPALWDATPYKPVCQ